MQHARDGAVVDGLVGLHGVGEVLLNRVVNLGERLNTLVPDPHPRKLGAAATGFFTGRLSQQKTPRQGTHNDEERDKNIRTAARLH